MFTIYGGKAAFDQWDKGQRVENPEMAAGDKVIFLNGCGETHPMKAYTYEGSVVCDVPNDLLRMARPILVDLCGSREHTTRLMVMPREKPDDYVYEDNTQGGDGVDYEEIERRLDSLAKEMVKTVNGVLPDDEQDVNTTAAYTAQFTINENGVACDVDTQHIKEQGATGRYLLYVPPVNPMLPKPTYECKKVSVESIHMGGGVYAKLLYRMSFDESVPDIVVDAVANKITLDPDWVAPTAALTEDDVNTLIDAKLGVIENGTY